MGKIIQKQPTLSELKVQVKELERTNRNLADRNEMQEETIKAYRRADSQYRSELDRARKEAEEHKFHELEAMRLRGVLDGLVRAGKIDPEKGT